MRNKVIAFLLLFTIIGCKDNQTNNVLKRDLNSLFNLNKYQITYEKKINDTLVQYRGENDRFLIKGNYNFKQKYKIGWWNIYDKKTGEKYLDIEFYKDIVKSKEVNNQIIVYQNNKIDTTNSKFYLKKISEDGNFILYNFYIPETEDKTYSAKINIGVIADGKPILYPTTFECKKNKNKYNYAYDISKNKHSSVLNIIGSFSEYSVNESKKELGINEILLDDTITIK